ncbi:hypothetical protein [Dinoroseobacter sp. S76]|uniref:hypothetical protein n=1 Tax=Dinoroseobacter sp. S76 TaxID=3415124 RepID=UPI003C7B8EA1
MCAAIRLAGLVACLAAPASAELLCVGTDPHFLMTIEGGNVAFDHLGEGRFTLIPPVDESEVLRSTRTHILETDQGNLPLLIKPEACPVLTTETPLSLEILVITSEGPRSFYGCCLIR